MNENDFGYRIRQALEEGLERLDFRTTYRLQQARQAALARQTATQTQTEWVPALQAAGGAPDIDDGSNWMTRLGLAAPLLALAIGFVGIYQYQESQRISEIANMDFAVLLDDVPIETYADKGFGALLKGESGD